MAYNGNKIFTITPNTGYHIEDVWWSGVSGTSVSLGPVNTYSFTNVKASHSISASFTINTYTVVDHEGRDR